MRRTESFADFLSTRRIPNLDGLRGLAIILVLAHHVPTSAASWVAQFQHNGKHGVSLFFVISGFIVMTLLLRELRRYGNLDLKGFLCRRALRLWPLYYLVLAAEGVLVYAAQVYSPENRALFDDKLVCYVLFCSNWLENSGVGPFFVSWSLAVEEQFYLLLTLLLAFLRPALLPLVFAGMLALKLALVHAGGGIDPGVMPWRVILSYSEAIILGVLLAYLLNDARGFAWFRRLAGTPARALLWLVLFMAFVAFGHLDHKSDLPALLFYVNCALLVGACAVNGPLPLLGTRTLSTLGLLSYGIYLLHMPVVSAVKRLTTEPLLVLSLTIAIVLPLAWLSFTRFEEPIRRLSRGRRDPTGQAPPPAADPRPVDSGPRRWFGIGRPSPGGSDL